MNILRWSLLAGGVWLLCSLVPFAVASADRLSGYPMMPGTICGVYASVILSGNPHGGEIAPFLVVASIVNYVFYSTVCYILLAVYVKFSKNILRGNGR
jgi:hypothetical protein